MQQVTVGTKYQIVIPKEIRIKLKGLKPGIKLSVQQIDENAVTLKIDPLDWIRRTAGMMTEAWKDIDPIAEIQKGRDEWEERLKKLEKSFK
ncbi:MAG: AbrB/MazE/SpoVT family DNA-binding domain-containing protein [Candidatus Levybacteria bacterium]|nr:AbrB/MazE/SpoVT family DNA-binding domain-containing protein [Candidatus Levybacteria bacterium]